MISRQRLLYILLAFPVFATQAASPAVNPAPSPTVAIAQQMQISGIRLEQAWLRFILGQDWKVRFVSTKEPWISLQALIPNPASANTPHTSEVAMVFSTIGSQQEKDMLAQEGVALGMETPARDDYHGWRVYRQRASQCDASYRVIDMFKKIGHLHAQIRMSWPYLPGNAPDYGQQMETLAHLMADNVDIAPPDVFKPGQGQIYRKKE